MGAWNVLPRTPAVPRDPRLSVILVAKKIVHLALRGTDAKRITVTGVFAVIPAKQESRVWTPDQVRGDGFIPTNRTKILATAITISRSISENRLVTKPALTSRPGQWHPTSGRHQALGATDLSFVRSVFLLANNHWLTANWHYAAPVIQY